MDPREIIDSIIDIEQAKSIDKNKVIDVIKEGLEKACKKQFGKDGKYEIILNEATGQLEVARFILVVDKVEDATREISLKEAKQLSEDIEVGDELEEELSIRSFGRLAINVMKQHITANLLKEERVSLFNEYSTKIDTLINGTIKKIDRRWVYVNLHRLEAKMPLEEGIPGERYRVGGLIKAIIVEVREGKGDPEVILSRKSDKFLHKLLEFEVPEIEEGTVVVKGIARIPGKKSKIAVMSIDDKIDPVGACVGVKGSRIHTIIRELNNEHIDIIQWSYDPIIFTQRVISPGVVIRAFKNEELMTMKLVVKDETYAKAVGRDGLNVDLASKLTGWQIQVISESEFKDETSGEDINPIYRIDGLTDNQKEKLINAGYSSPEDIMEKGEDELLKLEGMGSKTVKKIFDIVKEYLNKGE